MVTLAEVKLYLRIESDQTAEDSLLEHYRLAAQIHAENVLQRPIATVGDENVNQAVLFLVGHWYRNREAVALGTISTVVPHGFDAVLFPEKKYPVY